MLLINAQFRPSRGIGPGHKPGVVYYRITQKSPRRVERMVNSDIKGADESILDTARPKIDADLRLLYAVIERREDSGSEFTIDDVVADFRLALSGADEMSEVIAKSKADRPFRSDIVSVGLLFRNDFRYVSGAETSGLSEFVFSQVQDLKRSKRTSRARSFIATMTTVTDYCRGKDLQFSDIDSLFVRGYSDWLDRQDITETTRSFYLRTLRTILRQASEQGLIADTSTWFGNVSVPSSTTEKSIINRAVDRETLGKIAGLNLNSDDQLELARDMFMFGFYCRGMELVDIVNLGPENVRDGYLVYRRRLKGVENRVPLGEQALTLINKYRRGCANHLFPILDNVGNILFSSLRNKVATAIKELGRRVGCPELSFNMNIGTWKAMMSQSNISELLFFGAS